MTLLSRLLGKRSAPTRLQTVIEALDYNKVHGIAKGMTDETQRTPTAMSLILLVTVGNFCRELKETQDKLTKTTGAPIRAVASYDVVAYEAAAFFHYSLMRERLSNNENDDEEDEEEEDDAYFDALRDAAHLTSRIVNDEAGFDVPPEMFLNRLIRYGLKSDTIEAELV